MYSNSPRWLQWLEKKIPWFSLPNLALYFLVLQGFGFLVSQINPVWLVNLVLIPQFISEQPWRLITFMAYPMSTGFWVIIVLWFLYFVVTTLEAEWGEFKLTIYVFISWAFSVIYSMTTGYPITTFMYIDYTLFLALATLMPEFEILLFMILPVKMKYLGWLTVAMLVYTLIVVDWYARGYIVLFFINYFLFFGPAYLNSIKQAKRRRDFQKSMGR